ncbi:MAG: AAA-like domain-containing protein [Nostoc sp. DedSLP01]
MEQFRSRRKRGVLLTSAGLIRLKSAIQILEITQNNGNRFTLEELSSRMDISAKTLSRLWSLNATVDQRTLRLCFNTFGLELSTGDYTIASEVNEDRTRENWLQTLEDKQKSKSPLSSIAKSYVAKKQPCKVKCCDSYPDGPVSLGSPLYIERPPLEKVVYHEITQNGCAIQIQSPRQMGKSSLVLRMLAYAQQQNYQTVTINCYQIEQNCLANLNELLYFLCWQVATQLGLAPNLNRQWDKQIDSKLNCSFYFQKYLLKHSQTPVVIVLNEVDRFFEYPDIAEDFLGLLRSWCEEARQNQNWQKLRLVMVYSTENYITFDINRSPFNIGLPVRLPEFTQEQVEELARRHGLDWSTGKESAALMSLVGGHPALIRIALYHICCETINLQDLIKEAIANGGIYRDHLWKHWIKLQKKPNLARAYADIAINKENIVLDPVAVSQLESLGLIKFEGERIVPRCQLYQAYFQQHTKSSR